MINDPLKRIEVIENELFPAILQDYTNGITDYCFAINVLKEYRGIGHQLIQKISYDKKIKHIEELEYQYQNCLNEIKNMNKDRSM